MSNRGPKIPKAPRKPKEAVKSKSRISVVAIVLASATLLGGLAAAVTFLPRLTPTVSDPSDADNPFSSSVTITNTGYLPLDSVEATVGIGDICPKDYPLPCPDAQFPDPVRDYPSGMRRNEWGPHDMAMDDRFTFALNDVYGSVPRYADIAVIVQYEIPWIHWKREKTFPLFTRKQTNGKLYWYWK